MFTLKGVCGRREGTLRAKSIDHVGVFHQHKVQPTAAALPACGDAKFTPPGLQQLSHLL